MKRFLLVAALSASLLPTTMHLWALSPKKCENACCVNGSAQTNHGVVIGWRATCPYGHGSYGWLGPIHKDYKDAEADANFHNLGGGHGAHVIFFRGPAEATD